MWLTVTVLDVMGLSDTYLCILQRTQRNYRSGWNTDRNLGTVAMSSNTGVDNAPVERIVDHKLTINWVSEARTKF